VLRSINPVPNQTACVGCHGPLEKSPINGVLVVDYHAATIRADAWRSAAPRCLHWLARLSSR
jgi:hypothetical protein